LTPAAPESLKPDLYNIQAGGGLEYRTFAALPRQLASCRRPDLSLFGIACVLISVCFSPLTKSRKRCKIITRGHLLMQRVETQVVFPPALAGYIKHLAAETGNSFASVVRAILGDHRANGGPSSLPTTLPSKRITVRLSDEQLRWCKQQGKPSDVIRNALWLHCVTALTGSKVSASDLLALIGLRSSSSEEEESSMK